MCTLTYLPLAAEAGQFSFLLTSNRDERTTRPEALFPVIQHWGAQNVLFPQDSAAGGTWIATGRQAVGRQSVGRQSVGHSTGEQANPAMLTACLLNGGFIAHTPSPPYRMSRGRIIPEAFAAQDVEAFLAEYDLDRIEPFTLVIIAHDKARITELRWDGQLRYISSKDITQPHIWSSATLYSAEAIRQREAWFATWMADKQPFTVEGIRAFHHFGGQIDPYNSLTMQRTGVMGTVSITTVECRDNQLTMWYEDLKRKTLQECNL
ncbi:MAG: NRDE family protein [Bacteroidota bacterium]